MVGSWRNSLNRQHMRIPTFLLCLVFFLFSTLPTLSRSGLKDQKTNAAPFLIQWEEQLLTVKVKNRSLSEVLREIAAQTGIVVIIRAPLEEIVSEEFSNLSLEKGLKKLSRNFNHVFVYGSRNEVEKAVEMRAVILYPKIAEKLSRKTKTSPIEPKKRPSQQQTKNPWDYLIKSMQDEDPDNREEAVELLASSKDGRALDPLIEVMLHDEDEDVRASAAEGLAELGDKKAIDSLIRALEDSSAEVRESVIEALAELGGEEIITPLRGALSDEDEDVREVAEDALDDVTNRSSRR